MAARHNTDGVCGIPTHRNFLVKGIPLGTVLPDGAAPAATIGQTYRP
jgi:hypothetical protein